MNSKNLNNNSTTTANPNKQPVPSGVEILSTCKAISEEMKEARMDILRAVAATGLVIIVPSLLMQSNQMTLCVSENVYKELCGEIQEKKK